jgi:hypothetical chaperone protein
MASATVLGLDFGTTNTVGALSPDGAPILFRDAAEDGEIFRSALCFWEEHVGNVWLSKAEAGPAAIEAFLELHEACRFLQSIKTFAGSAAFRDTRINGRLFNFQDLMATFLSLFARHARLGEDHRPGRIVVGRPVAFAGASPDAALAEARYRAALGVLGGRELHFVYEPVAAAYFFAQRLERDATVLVGDFGGGTSDFSLVRFARVGGRLTTEPLGHSGVGVAGDTFDQRIIQHVVAPHLGKGSTYRSFGKVLEVPGGFYVDLARWNQLALMRSEKTLRDIRAIAHTALQPELLERLIAFIEGEEGYPLYRAVSGLKIALSSQDEAALEFRAGSATIRETVRRADFETWIADDLAKIDRAVDVALVEAKLPASDVDRVFLTGGSSRVPAVQSLFRERFASSLIQGGDELVSIARGLALIGASQDLPQWVVTEDVGEVLPAARPLVPAAA